MPTNENINVFVEHRLLSNIGPTVDTMKIFFDHFPQGNAVAFTIEHVWRLKELSNQASTEDDDYLERSYADGQREGVPMEMYCGARAMATDSVDVGAGVVNGAFGVITSVGRDCLVVRRDSGTEAALHRMAFEVSDGSFQWTFRSPTDTRARWQSCMAKRYRMVSLSGHMAAYQRAVIWQ